MTSYNVAVAVSWFGLLNLLLLILACTYERKHFEVIKFSVPMEARMSLFL